MAHSPRMIGYILAGGRSARMGGEPKGFKLLDGQPLLGHVIARIAPQVDQVVINTNAPPAAFAAFPAEIIADDTALGEGPLTGLAACFAHAAAHRPDSEWIAAVPWDCPFLPDDLIGRLRKGAGTADAAIAVSNGRAHWLTGIFRLELAGHLGTAMAQRGSRAAKDWLATAQVARIPFSEGPPDPFFNINSPADLEAAEQMLRRC